MNTSPVAQRLEVEVQRKMAQAGVPEHLRDGLMRYLCYGIEPGGFLMAVLENNLSEAMGRADSMSRAGLFEICSFVYNDMPWDAWGNPERVKVWLHKDSR